MTKMIGTKMMVTPKNLLTFIVALPLGLIYAEKARIRLSRQHAGRLGQSPMKLFLVLPHCVALNLSYRNGKSMVQMVNGKVTAISKMLDIIFDKGWLITLVGKKI
jgi:hypothetical protein